MTVFLSSAGALIIEIVAGRMLAPYVGMSLYTWTAIIAVVLAGLSVGHWLGGELSSGSRARSCGVLALAMLLAAGATAFSLVLIRLLSPLILGVGFDPILAIALLSACLFFLPTLFIGVISPILTKLAVEEAAPHHRGRVIGQMYALGAAGSIVGTLAAGYVFISWVGSIGTVLAVAAVYAMLGVVFGLAARAARRVAATVIIAALLLLSVGGVVAKRVGALRSPCTIESNYYCIRVIDYSAEAGRPSALMVLDHLGHGINDRDDPTRLESSYLALIDTLWRSGADHDAEFAALFIGGGAYTLPRAWSVIYPHAKLTVAEIDPAVTRVARGYMWLQKTPNLKIVHEDGRMLLQSLPATPQFDIVVGDAFHDISAPPHLVTRELAVEVRKRLKPDGLYTLNVLDSARRPLFLLSAVNTLQQVFPSVEVWVDIDQLRGGGRTTYIVRAATTPSPVARLQSSTAGGHPGRTWWRWPPAKLKEDIVSHGVPVLTDDYAPVDRLMFPVLKEDL